MKVSKKFFDTVFWGLFILGFAIFVSTFYFRTSTVIEIRTYLRAIPTMIVGIIACQAWLAEDSENPALFLKVRCNHVLVVLVALMYLLSVSIIVIELGYYRALWSIVFVIAGILFARQRHKTIKAEEKEKEDEIVNELGVN